VDGAAAGATRSADAAARLTAPLNYLAPPTAPLRTYAFDPPDGSARFNGRLEAHRVAIADARPIRDTLSLASHGFMLVDHASAVRDWWDEAALERLHYPEVEALLAKLTGASRVVVFDRTLRRRGAGRPTLDGSGGSFAAVREPVGRVHLDYTAASGPARAREVLGAVPARFMILGVWRPILATPLVDAPLALADARSVHARDLVRNELVYPHRRGETFAVLHSPNHCWFHFPLQRRDEAIVFKHFDSEGARGECPCAVAHSAFDDPGAPPDAPPRESLELRALASFEPAR